MKATLFFCASNQHEKVVGAISKQPTRTHANNTTISTNKTPTRMNASREREEDCANCKSQSIQSTTNKCYYCRRHQKQHFFRVQYHCHLTFDNRKKKVAPTSIVRQRTRVRARGPGEWNQVLSIRVSSLAHSRRVGHPNSTPTTSTSTSTVKGANNAIAVDQIR